MHNYFKENMGRFRKVLMSYWEKEHIFKKFVSKRQLEDSKYGGIYWDYMEVVRELKDAKEKWGEEAEQYLKILRELKYRRKK